MMKWNVLNVRDKMFEDISKKYNTVVIDPPWQININKVGNRFKKHKMRSELPYSTMTLQEISKIPIDKIANIGTHVYCWTTNKMLNDTFNILKAWGVDYHMTLVMVKPSGLAPSRAMYLVQNFVY